MRCNVMQTMPDVGAHHAESCLLASGSFIEENAVFLFDVRLVEKRSTVKVKLLCSALMSKKTLSVIDLPYSRSRLNAKGSRQF